MRDMGIPEEDINGESLIQVNQWATGFFHLMITWHEITVVFEFLFVALFRVVSAVLQFGNMVFKQERSSEQAMMPSNEGYT